MSIRDLTIVIENQSDRRIAVNRLSVDIDRGQTVALMGESGSGKTLTALATLGILPSPPAKVATGSIHFQQTSLLTLPENKMRSLRGDRIAMIFQEPITSLNPLMPVGQQIGEGMRLHQGLGKRSTAEQVLALMEMVGIPDPKRRYRSYPHQLSGGIRQRVMIAMALSCRPDLLLADEPTSALDTTVQAQIVDLLSRLIRDLGMSVLLITHDIGVVAAMADRVLVVYNGQVVEEGSVREILKDPLHPYTQSLLAAQPLANRNARIPIGTDNFISLSNLDGCPFAVFCQKKADACQGETANLVDFGGGRKVRCLALRGTNGRN